ncbi:MAG TPA: hypothetical protein VHB98_16315 [Chloroflexota bacterium]|nr:hypothetical protein [Chloroflexota bacterium]
MWFGARLVLVAGILLGTVLGYVARAGAPAALHSSAAASHYAGWAMDAYPGDSEATLVAEMQRQVQAGANVVWLGHNNPGEVSAQKHEPALSYAVWAAYEDPRSPDHAVAAGMVQAQRAALQAARTVGVKVVLPVGYQIQMGAAWAQAHPRDMRRNASGTLYWQGGNSASFYAPDYRRDILAYYRWVDATLVRPYAGVVFMINVADEPQDGDWSTWADAAFRAQHGYGLFQAGHDPVRQEAVGRFQADYIAEYAAWSAQQWQALDPAMMVTLSFDGGYGRYMHEGPDLEAIFRDTPSNFVVTFDAYPRDGLYSTPLREQDLISLFNLVRTLGYYSAVYGKPLWLWSTANSWGLNAASSDPGNIADAVANGIYLAQLVSQSGGDLQGIAVWNYNIKTQGLFNDTHHLTYDPNQMFARVSASFDLWRQIMGAPPGQVTTVILAPNEPALQQAGAKLVNRANDLYHWSALALPARNNMAAVTLTHLDGEVPPGLHTAIVLARHAADLSAIDRQTLLTLLSHGGAVIANGDVAAALAGTTARDQAQILASGGRPALVVRRVAAPDGTLLAVDGGPAEYLFADANASWAAPIWQQILGHGAQSGGYLVAAGGVTLLYSGTAQNGASISLPVPATTPDLTLYDTTGALAQTMPLAGRSGVIHVLVARRSYALLPAAL